MSVSTLFCRHPLPFLTLLFLLVATSLSAQREWEHLSEPFAGLAYPPIEIDGGVVTFVGGGGRMQVSWDDGATWEPYGVAPFGVIPYGWVNGKVLAFAGNEGGVYLVTGNGDTLTRTNNGLTGRVLWARTAPDDSAYAMSTDGLFVSGDGGEGWVKRPHEFGDNNGTQSIGFHGDDVMIIGVGTVWYSRDRGMTFENLNDRLPTAPVNGVVTRSGAILVGTWGGIYRSTDRGETFHFHSLSRELPLFYGIAGETDEGDLFIGTWSGETYRVSEDGLFTRRYELPALYVFDTYVLSSGTVLLGDFGTGMWRMEKGEEDFTQVGSLHAILPTEIKRGSKGEMMVKLNTGVAVSEDGGGTWEYNYVNIELTAGGFYESIFAFHPLEDGTILGIGNTGSVVRWRDGEEPAVALDQLGVPTGRAAVQTESGAIILSDTGGSFRSTDGGLTWAAVDHSTLSMAVAGDGSVWSAAEDLYVSRDDGQTFAPVASVMDSAVTIYPAPGGDLYLIGFDGDEEVHFLSANNGASWNEVEMPCTGTEYTSIEDMGGKPGLGAITDCGVQYWDPEEKKWDRKIIALPENERGFTSLYHNEEYLVAGGIGGLYRSPDVILSVWGGDETGEREGLEFSAVKSGDHLEITLTSDIPRTLRPGLFSVEGEQVESETVWNVEPGTNHLTIPLPDGLPSGVYIVRLLDGGYRSGAGVLVPIVAGE